MPYVQIADAYHLGYIDPFELKPETPVLIPMHGNDTDDCISGTFLYLKNTRCAVVRLDTDVRDKWLVKRQDHTAQCDPAKLRPYVITKGTIRDLL